jgi:hypothetical protein
MAPQNKGVKNSKKQTIKHYKGQCTEHSQYSFQARQIIFEMQRQREQPRRAVKKIHFVELQNTLFSFFFILIPLTSSVHNFLQKKISN